MKLLIMWMGLISMIWAMPVDVEENDIYELEKKSVAIINKVEGKVKVLSKDSIKKHKAKLGEALFEGDKLITYNEAKVFIELDDSSKLILNESSELSFVNNAHLKHLSGEIYYKIKTRKATQGLRVETPFSIMGIKGTEFIVDAKGKGQIALNEGLVGIEALHANFELHKQKVMEEYEKFKKEQNAGFEAYKAEMEGKVISYVKSFDLESGKVLNFSQASECIEACGAKVQEEEMSESLNKRFELYDEMLKEIQEQQIQ